MKCHLLIPVWYSADKIIPETKYHTTLKIFANYLSMGIHNRTIKFLSFAKDQGVLFDRTLTLGYQSLQTSASHATKILSEYLKVPATQIKSEELAPGKPIDYTLKLLGAKYIDSMDMSNFENANILHDLNLPIPETLELKYDLVIDSGTLEHIFNFPMAIYNCMKMVKTGGHFIGISPVNNTMGHGFYQFSPELYYRIFCHQYGFEVQKMFLCTRYDSLNPVWFEVSDPDKVRDRITLENKFPTILYIIAKKNSDKNDMLAFFPQQSDYSHLWSKKENNDNIDMEYRDDHRYTNTFLNELSKKKVLPDFLKKCTSKVYTILHRGNSYEKGLGYVNTKYYSRKKI